MSVLGGHCGNRLPHTCVSYSVSACNGYSATPPSLKNDARAPVHFQICTAQKPGMPLSEAIAHLPTALGHTSPSFFPRDTLDPFLPAKADMDPDRGHPGVPLLSIKITLFPAGGTAIGLLLQHSVADADTQMAFVRNWSRVFRGLALEPAPLHDRCIVNRLVPERQRVLHSLPEDFKVKAVPPGEQSVPAFMGVLPKISGAQVSLFLSLASLLHPLLLDYAHGPTPPSFALGNTRDKTRHGDGAYKRRLLSRLSNQEQAIA